MEESINIHNNLVLGNGRRKSETPLSVETGSTDKTEWAKVAAYMSAVSFHEDNITPKVGDVLEVDVNYPVCCRVGGIFSALFDDFDGIEGTFITMRLLSIESQEESSAVLKIEIIAICNRLFFVKPVSEEKKEELLESHYYDYDAPPGTGVASYFYIEDDVAQFENDFGGDVFYSDFIFTDVDGIDHLVQSNYDCWDNREAYFGDKVLGFHADSPYFRAPEKLDDGSSAPEIPYGFMDPFTRMVLNEGIDSFLNTAIEAAKTNDSFDIAFNTCNELYDGVAIAWIGTLSVEGFVYAIKKIIGLLYAQDEEFVTLQICDKYNELIRNLAERSLHGDVLKKHLIVVG